MSQGATGRFTNPEDYQASLPDLISELVVTEAGVFDARLTWAKLPNVNLLRAQETLTRVAYLTLPDSSIVVTFATRRGPDLVSNGIELAFGDLVLHSRGECLHQRTTGPIHWGFLAIRPAFLARHGSALAGRDLNPPAISRIVRPRLADRKRLFRLHARIIRLAETRPLTMVHHPEVGRAIEQELLQALVSCLMAGEADDERWPPRDHVVGMAKLEHALAARPAEALDMPTLCRLTGIGERTLQTCCGAFLGMSPARYVRLRRLKLARAAILAAGPAKARVAISREAAASAKLEDSPPYTERCSARARP